MNHQIQVHRTALALAIAFAAAAGIVVAKTKITAFTSTDTDRVVIDPGKITIAGDNIHVRDSVADYTRNASDPRVTGTVRVNGNFNVDAEKFGPLWGTFHADVGGGSWDGTFQGWTDLIVGQNEFEGVGHGSGEFRGLQLRQHCVTTGPGRPINCTGTITQVSGN